MFDLSSGSSSWPSSSGLLGGFRLRGHFSESAKHGLSQFADVIFRK